MLLALLVGCMAAAVVYGVVQCATQWERWSVRQRRAKERRITDTYQGLVFGFPDEPPVPPMHAIQEGMTGRVVGIIVGPRLGDGPEAFFEHERERGAIS